MIWFNYVNVFGFIMLSPHTCNSTKLFVPYIYIATTFLCIIHRLYTVRLWKADAFNTEDEVISFLN